MAKSAVLLLALTSIVPLSATAQSQRMTTAPKARVSTVQKQAFPKRGGKKLVRKAMVPVKGLTPKADTLRVPRGKDIRKGETIKAD